MKSKFLFIVLIFTVSGCSQYSFQSDLILAAESSQACQAVKPHAQIDNANSEVIAVNFNNSLSIIELTPEGDKKSAQPVSWSLRSYDRTEIYAFLSQPDKLKVNGINSYDGKNICITFKQKLFEDDELGLDEYRTLADANCCGILTKKKIEKDD